jgi:hypothetical protein
MSSSTSMQLVIVNGKYCCNRCIGMITTDLLNYCNHIFERLQLHNANQCNCNRVFEQLQLTGIIVATALRGWKPICMT